MMRRVLALLILAVFLSGFFPPATAGQDAQVTDDSQDAPAVTVGQVTPDPRPETVPYFYDAARIFPDDQLTTLSRDAQLLQSSNIPTLVYVREATIQQASREEAQAFADLVRAEWAIGTEEGADDGLVLLLSWVPENPQASTAVFSYGAATFEGSGLTPESIQHTIDTSVASLIEQGRPFETLVYLMRETRYTGIYAPPPPPPIEGAAQTVHRMLEWAAPLAAVAVAVLIVAKSITFWRIRPTSKEIWTIAGGVLGSALILWIAAVYAQSRIGVGAALLMMASLALGCWVWTHNPYTNRHAISARRRSVPPTRRLMRQRHQARKMLARATGNSR